MAYRDQEDYVPRMPRSQSFHPTPNSLLASSQYQQYSDPHQPHQPLNGYSGRPQSQYNQQRQYNRQSQYRDEYEDDDKPLRPSYYEQGEDRDEGFDVRADFDGKGPRWSEMYGTGRGDPRNYAALEERSNHAPSINSRQTTAPKSAMGLSSREELVAVPVLGAEWQKSELHELSRRGKSEVRKEKRERIWREWVRDQRGVCGIHWLTRKALVITISILVVVTGLILFFTIPRPPAYAFYVQQPFTVNNSTVSFARTPANFTFTGNLNMLADTSNSYLPLQTSDVEVQLYHLTTNKQVASGHLGKSKINKGKDVPVVIPVTFSYSAINATDTTWNDFYSACGHIWTGTTRPPLRLRLVLKSSIVGLVTHPETSAIINDVVCPFELPSNSV